MSARQLLFCGSLPQRHFPRHAHAWQDEDRSDICGLEDAREERDRARWLKSDCPCCRGTQEDHESWCKGNEA